MNDKITINGEEFEEVYRIGFPEENKDFAWYQGKMYKKIKKEEPKFPKIFETLSYKIKVYNNCLLEIISKYDERSFNFYESLDVLKEAIKYQEENQ